jgi:hypothetical protein
MIDRAFLWAAILELFFGVKNNLQPFSVIGRAMENPAYE